MIDLRTPETAEKYRSWRAERAPDAPCILCEKAALKEFTYWKVIPNDFPYDRVAAVHHMLVPIRHVREDELTSEEISELALVKAGFVNDEYDYVLEATNKTKTIPSHFHLHLVVGAPHY